MEMRTPNHCSFDLRYHVVWTTKYRHRCINLAMLVRMEDVLRGTCAKWRCELVEFSGEPDHVHPLIAGHPSLDVSQLVANLKTVSARAMRKEFGLHLARYYWKAKFWANSYAVVSAGGHASMEQLLAYIQNQERPSA